MTKITSIITIVAVGFSTAVLNAEDEPNVLERTGESAVNVGKKVGETVKDTVHTGVDAARSGLGWTVDTVEAGGKTVGNALKSTGKASLRTADTAFGTVGLDTELSEEGPYTLFAPDDEAFEKLPKERREDLMKAENKGELRKLLDHHVADGDITPEQAAEIKAKTRAGDKVVFKENNRLRIGDSEVTVKERIKTRNGTVYVIDSVVEE